MIWGIIFFVIAFLIYLGVSILKKNEVMAHTIFMVAGSIAAIAGLYIITNFKVTLVACAVTLLVDCFFICRNLGRKPEKNS